MGRRLKRRTSQKTCLKEKGPFSRTEDSPIYGYEDTKGNPRIDVTSVRGFLCLGRGKINLNHKQIKGGTRKRRTICNLE
jgi:hypothetical protein